MGDHDHGSRGVGWPPGRVAACFLLALIVLATGNVVVALADEAGAESEEPEEYFWLPRQRMVLRSLTIERENVFPEDDPYAASFYGRLANSLHIVTRKHVIRRGVRMAPGDTVTAERLGSVMRRLRTYYFLHDDVRFDLAFSGDSLDLGVTTRDVWTTRPTFQFRKTGDLLTWSVGLEEGNLMGWGKGVGVFLGEGEIRPFWGLWYLDRQFMSTQAYFRAVVSRGEDTELTDLSLGRPFERALTQWGFEIEASDYEGPFIDRRGGLDGPEWTSDQWTISSSFGPRVAGRRRTALRIKPAAYMKHERFAPPDSSEISCYAGLPGECNLTGLRDRDIRGVGLELDYVHERFTERTDINSIRRREDFNLGTEFRLRLARSFEAWGATEDGWVVQLEGLQGKPLGPKSFLRSTFKGTTEVKGGRAEDARFWSSTAFYSRLSSFQTIAVRLRADFSRRAIPQKVFTMGAESALRGFEAYSFWGEQLLQLNLEDRWVMWDNLLGLLSIGAVTFLDVGVAWNEGDHRNSTARASAGAGLRLLGSRTRGAFVTRVDLGYPVLGRRSGDGWILSIAAGQAF